MSDLREAGLIPDSFEPEYVDEFAVGIKTGDPKLPNYVNIETFPTLDEARQWRRIVPDSTILNATNVRGEKTTIYRAATVPGKFGGVGGLDGLTRGKLVILHEYGHEVGGFSSEAAIDAWALKQLNLP